jgi:subtilisin family serine protease
MKKVASLRWGSLVIFAQILTATPIDGQKTVDHTVILTGHTWPIKVDLNLVQGRRGERMAPVVFANGARGLLTSTVVVGADAKSFAALIAENGGRHAWRRARFADAYLVQMDHPHDALEFAAKASRGVMVRFAHPDFVFPLEARSSPFEEPYFHVQWSLKNIGQNGATAGVDIGVEQAWRVTRGSPQTTVAVLDLGFEQGHRDLLDAWFVNTKEIPDNKKDDDRNGLIDDVRGWNFSTNGNNLIYGAAANHGTATAGIIGARANGIGITGVCPECKILPLVVSGRVSEDADAVAYAVSMGASVMSNSWGYAMESPRTDVVMEALTSAANSGRRGLGVPILFAMHNSEVNDCRPSSPDISAHPRVLAVSSIDFNDMKVPDTAWGPCLAFLGPSSGSNTHGIATTDRSGHEGYNVNGADNFSDLDFHNGFWGTSAATPHVAGLFALLLAAEPGLTRDQALSRMKGSAIKANPAVAAYDPVSGHSLRYGFGRAHGGRLFSQELKNAQSHRE